MLDGNKTSLAGASTAAWAVVAANSKEDTEMRDKELAMAKEVLE